MTGNGTGSSRSAGLDALRLFAALFVVLYHYADQAPVDPTKWLPILSNGWIATDLFIMLSGFVLGRMYGPRIEAGGVDAPSFLAQRIRRVWPAHLIVLVGFAALVLGTAAIGLAPQHPERFLLADLPANAALIQGWGFLDHLSWNGPSWTLSALIVCWAGFPYLWRAAKPLEGRAAALLLALDVLAVAALACRLGLHVSPWRLPVSLSLLRAIPLFAAGALLARAVKGLQFGPGEATLTAIGAGWAVLLFASAKQASDLSELGVVLALAFLIISTNASSFLQGAWTEQGAKISFSLFITHSFSGALWFGAVRLLGARVVLGSDSRWILWIWGLLFAIGFAWAFERWVDAPAQRALTALLARRLGRVRQAEA